MGGDHPYLPRRSPVSAIECSGTAIESRRNQRSNAVGRRVWLGGSEWREERPHPGGQSKLQRLHRTVRQDRPHRYLNHFVIFGERHLLREFVTHYNTERFHQGLGGKLVQPMADTVGNDNGSDGGSQCRSHLGGVLSFSSREAA